MPGSGVPQSPYFALALLAPVGADEAAARRLDDLEHIALRRVGVAPRESDPDVLHGCFG